MTVLTERKGRFISGDTECAAWHYPGTNGACVIMAGGGAVTKEPGTDLFAGQPGTVAMLTTPDSIDVTERSTLATSTRAGSRRSPPAPRRKSGCTGPAATRPACEARCWSWSATRIRWRSPDLPSARRTVLPGENSSSRPAGTTSRSSAGTSKPSRLSCPSCAGICLITPHRTGPPPRNSRRTEADEREADRVGRRADRILRHRWRPAGACAAARGDDGCLTLGRADG